MSLSDCANGAEDIATGFWMFREPLPEHATGITGLMADLYSISVALKTLDDLSANRAYRHNLAEIQADIDAVLASISYTFEDIIDFFYKLQKQGARSSPKLFRRTWEGICDYFWAESNESLSTRLLKYRTFLNELQYKLTDKPFDPRLIKSGRVNVKNLLAMQEPQEPRAPPRPEIKPPRPELKCRPSSSSSVDPDSPVSERRPRKRRSYERHRPPSSLQSPDSPLSPGSGTGTFSSVQIDTPNTSQAPSSASTTPTDLISDHWAKPIFREEHQLTPFPPSGQISRCFGEPSPDFNYKTFLRKEGYEEIIQMAFNDDYNLRAIMYCRQKDYRARLACKLPGRNKDSDYYSRPLNLLEVSRAGPCLQFRERGRRKGDLFMELKFKTVERMILFFCTFLALRSQDRGRPIEEIHDHELKGEVEWFSGKIYDDQFVNRLRILHDIDTGAIRLQASIYQGEMKRTPVWTAFINKEVRSRSWARLSREPDVVILRDLDRKIFTHSDYIPLKTQTGEHILKFASRRDARFFLARLHEIRPDS